MKADPLLGLEIDGYRVLSVIGRGGMGVVYRAENQAGEAIAVKFMAPELAQSPEFRERFMREASSSLDHDHIVPVYGTGEHNGLLYLKMYLVQGEDLKVLIQREGKILPARTIPIFEQAASALDEAHAAAIVHRDVKPQNILIESSAVGEDHVFLSDFGLVKRVAAESSFTGSAHLVGSAQYMSPEQIQGKEIDGRADVYSLGCVAFEALTGQVPYPQEEEVAVLFAHVNDPVPRVTEHTPVLPDSVDHVIEKAMAKAPDDRYLTAGDMVAALAFELGVSSKMARTPWAAGGISTSAVRRREARLKAANLRASAVTDSASVRAMASSRGFVVGVAATLAVLLAFFLLSNEEGRERVGGFIGAVTDAIPFVDDPQPADGSAPDHGPTALDDSDDGDRRSASPTERKVDPPGFLEGADNAPGTVDNSRDDPSERDTENPPPPETGADPSISIAFHSTDTDNLSGCCDYGIFVMDADGSDVTMLYNGNTTASGGTFVGDVDDTQPAWSPDGRRVAFTRAYDLHIIRTDGSDLQRRTDGSWDKGVEWSPDGTRFVFARNPEDVEPPAPEHLWEIYSMDVNGGGLKQLTHNNAADYAPNWSPDGDNVAFMSDRGPGEDMDIYVMRADGTGVTRLIGSVHDEFHPAWSPDGTKLAFARFNLASRTADLFVLTLATGDVVQVSQHGRVLHPAWSPDGRWIAFDSGGGDAFTPSGFGGGDSNQSGQDIWKIRSNGRRSPAINLTNTPDVLEGAPDWR